MSDYPSPSPHDPSPHDPPPHDPPPHEPSPPTPSDSPRAAVMAVRDEVAKVIVGQEGVLSGLVVAM
ncbi:MAG: AAA family ATPase, partial [Actinobacteria bacterium]|nr:AAA family ATPase [Actinomycetota bacterium]